MSAELLESIEPGPAMTKAKYRKASEEIRGQLLDRQDELRKAQIPVIVLFAGVDGAGKGEIANLLNSWMDPRGLLTHAFDEPTEEERQRPEMGRFWLALPPRGAIGVYLRAWYHGPLLSRVYGEVTGERFERQLERIRSFEQMLIHDGALVLKFWLHLGKDAQKERLQRLQQDPDHAWRVTPMEWEHWHMYERFIDVTQDIIAKTGTAEADWMIVEGSDLRSSSLRVASALIEKIDERLAKDARDSAKKRPRNKKKHAGGSRKGKGALAQLEMGVRLERKEYVSNLERLQARLNGLHRRARARNTGTVLVFEGWDAAGKGGAIRRITGALDARHVRVIPIGPPSEEERLQHYLWRFWRHLPGPGRMTIFDRSWYGRVLVERVEGFANEAEWRRAYDEIRDFEEQLVEHGIALAKFWLHVTPEEQERRFRERERTSYKRWKLTAEDWRNRERRLDYEVAAHDMIAADTNPVAPWTLVPADDKRYARIKVLEAVCYSLESALSEPPAARMR